MKKVNFAADYEKALDHQIANVTEMQSELRTLIDKDVNVDDIFLKQLDERIAEMKQLVAELKNCNQNLADNIK